MCMFRKTHLVCIAVVVCLNFVNGPNGNSHRNKNTSVQTMADVDREKQRGKETEVILLLVFFFWISFSRKNADRLLSHQTWYGTKQQGNKHTHTHTCQRTIPGKSMWKTIRSTNTKTFGQDAPNRSKSLICGWVNHTDTHVDNIQYYPCKVNILFHCGKTH